MWDRRENIVGSLVVKWLDIENLTIEQYLLLTQESQTQGMVRTEFSSVITKDIEDMTIAEYMEYKDKDEEEDDLIDILKTVFEECKSIYQKAQIPSSRTSKIQGVSFVEEEEEGEIILRYMLWLMLTGLKKTSMVVEMADMTKKAPLGIVENIPVKIDKFLFHSNFVVIDMLEGPNETMLLGRPFFATIHAQIDVFRGEISLGIGNEKVKFDTNGEICHSRGPHEKIYMASSIQKDKYFNPHEVENDDSPALEQRTLTIARKT
ncbi:copia protein [Tanacetum coccineum]